MRMGWTPGFAWSESDGQTLLQHTQRNDKLFAHIVSGCQPEGTGRRQQAIPPTPARSEGMGTAYRGCPSGPRGFPNRRERMTGRGRSASCATTLGFPSGTLVSCLPRGFSQGQVGLRVPGLPEVGPGVCKGKPLVRGRCPWYLMALSPWAPRGSTTRLARGTPSRVVRGSETADQVILQGVGPTTPAEREGGRPCPP